MPAYCFLDVLKTTCSEEMKGDRNGGASMSGCHNVEPSTFVIPQGKSDGKSSSLWGNRSLATLLVQLEEAEEQIDNLQQLRSDLLKEIASAQQQMLLKKQSLLLRDTP